MKIGRRVGKQAAMMKFAGSLIVQIVQTMELSGWKLVRVSGNGRCGTKMYHLRSGLRPLRRGCSDGRSSR